MSASAGQPVSLQGGSGNKFPLNSLLALVLALAVLSAGMVFGRYRDEQRRMIQAMKGQADVLIWALEGASRSLTHMGTPRNSTRYLVEEVAKQPNIAYLSIVNRSGVVVAHSDPDLEGRETHSAEELDAVAGTDESGGRFTDASGERVYEVGKRFTPTFGHRHGRRGDGFPPGGRPDRADYDEQSFFVFVGVDPAGFEEGFQDNVRSAVLLAFLMVLTGACLLTVFHMLRKTRYSSRLLRDAQSFRAQLFENLPMSIVTTDPGGLITMHNRLAARVFGMPVKPKARQNLHDYPLTDWQGLMREVDEGSPVLERETTLALPGGGTQPVSVSATHVTTGEGKPAGYLFILRDLGEIKKLQKQLRLSERLSALGSMAAGVAHEIRNPLSTIKGYATYLSGKFGKEDPAHETGTMMIREVERLNRVVSDLLSVARVGRISPAPADPAQVLEHALRLVRPEAEAKQVELALEPAPAPLPALVEMDADKVIQALLNLLINAVQATEPGGRVSLSADFDAGTGNAPGSLRISVKDTGKGMNHEEQAQVFTPYFSTKASGTGLGLTIAHRIIEQHGGDIGVHSQPGKGSVFTVSLPAEQPADEE